MLINELSRNIPEKVDKSKVSEDGRSVGAFINVLFLEYLINGKDEGVGAFINDDTWHCMVGYGESDVAYTLVTVRIEV